MDDLVVQEGVTIPGWELWVTTSRASGPGGQHVNKTSSRVTLHWAVARTTALDERQRERVMRRLAARIDKEGVLQLSAESARSQLQNKEEARERLAALVRGALVVQPRRLATRPSKGAVRRRLDEKSQRGALKQQRGQRFDPEP
ncbi:MAG: aminoacyl-tRNA hydrolase [Myxococcales bacterium]|nr:aminoacyl-tRNA hydrolase [Myxococcales bacterium]